MVGFGAAITDASAWLIQNKLNEQQRSALLNELFGKAPGAGFSFTRLTIGASDFSRHHYSFDDMPPGRPIRNSSTSRSTPTAPMCCR
jgi:glucosylceramidase